MPAVAERASTEPPSRPPRPKGVRRSRQRSRWRDRGEYAVLRTFMGALATAPLAVAFRVAEALAWLAYVVDRPHRRIGMITIVH